MKYDIRKIAYLRPDTNTEAEALRAAVIEQQLHHRVGVVLQDTSPPDRDHPADPVTPNNVAGGILYIDRDPTGFPAGEPQTEWDALIHGVRLTSPSAADTLALIAKDDELDYVWYEEIA